VKRIYRNKGKIKQYSLIVVLSVCLIMLSSVFAQAQAISVEQILMKLEVDLWETIARWEERKSSDVSIVFTTTIQVSEDAKGYLIKEYTAVEITDETLKELGRAKLIETFGRRITEVLSNKQSENPLEAPEIDLRSIGELEFKEVFIDTFGDILDWLWYKKMSVFRTWADLHSHLAPQEVVEVTLQDVEEGLALFDCDHYPPSPECYPEFLSRLIRWRLDKLY